jgi:hypothetical protein
VGGSLGERERAPISLRFRPRPPKAEEFPSVQLVKTLCGVPQSEIGRRGEPWAVKAYPRDEEYCGENLLWLCGAST